MKTPESPFSSNYVDRLLQDYPAHLVTDITSNIRQADLTEPSGESISYVVVNEGGSRPVMYVPGFTEGLVAKAPFAAELANHGHEVILPDQNRKKIMKDTLTGKCDATFTQANNYIAVLQAEGIDNDGPVDFVTHSYGSLIFDAMHTIGRSRGMSAFEGSRVVMLAPAGFNDNETIPDLLRRFVAMTRAEDKAPKQYGDLGGEMLKAGVKNITANAVRAIREGLHLADRKLDSKKLLSQGVAKLAIVSYAEDPLYSDAIIESAARRSVDNGASWSVPVALDLHGPLGTEGSSHNDEQFNPTRTGKVVSSLLKQG